MAVNEHELYRRAVLADTLQSNTVTISAFTPEVSGTHTLTVDATSKVVGSIFAFTSRAELSPESAPYYDWSGWEIYRDGVLLYTAPSGMFPRGGNIQLEVNFQDNPPAGDHTYYAITYVQPAV